MSGPRAGPDPGGQLYGDHQPTAGDDGVGSSSSVFFQNSARDTAVDTGGGTTRYSSINDYLQGFMEPPGHLDAPPVYAAEGDMIALDGRHGRKAAGGSATPITPISSTTSEPRRGNKGRSAPDDEGEVDEEAVSADHQNHRSVTKKKKEKKERGSRVAFATKSEVDHLDDGYRWRKYGQKAVKNSSFPRSYYRCTTARCGVKKQVERSQHDPSTVVTTYEGHHAHPSPAAHRGMATGANGLYSLATLQQQRHGFCPSSPDDLLLAAAARAMAPPAATASPAALLPRQAENRLGEYYGLQLQGFSS